MAETVSTVKEVNVPALCNSTVKAFGAVKEITGAPDPITTEVAESKFNVPAEAEPASLIVPEVNPEKSTEIVPVTVDVLFVITMAPAVFKAG